MDLEGKFEPPGHNSLSCRIAGIASYLPKNVLGNDELARLFPEWTSDKILEKTGIEERKIAAADQTAADLAFEAAKRLFQRGVCSPDDVDFVILCTQAPDYILPTTACLLQYRLGIPRSAGALDVNLGCSGFVYGLSLAKGLIETGSASSVLLLTADTYSKYIDPNDKTVRTLFGDGAAATLITAASKSSGSSIGPFVFGTDGSGAKNLIVESGGFRVPKASGLVSKVHGRRLDCLFMDGAEVMAFTLSEVPPVVEKLLVKSNLTYNDFDYFVLHQANKFMLDSLRRKLKIPAEKVPLCVKKCGNTVSSSIPIALEQMLSSSALVRGQRLLLVGFGVGYSWAAAVLNF